MFKSDLPYAITGWDYDLGKLLTLFVEDNPWTWIETSVSKISVIIQVTPMKWHDNMFYK